MLLREIEKLDHLNISFALFHVKDTELHIHDAYEIIFVLRGSVNLKCTIFNYSLTAGDIFIINVKELHRFSNGSDDNLILRMHLDPYAYLNIFPKLDFYLFVCDSFASTEKKTPKLVQLQRLLIKLFFTVTDCPSYSVSHAEEQILAFITYLINHFQSFYLTKQGYYANSLGNGDSSQLGRIAEIQEYIYKNAKKKISLENLADHLHLNKFYVSHLIKNNIGLSMTDFLSLARVEQSEYLLLSTDMGIEQIALECGFSAKRYYEKHFMRWFDMSPSDYRKQFTTLVQYCFHSYDLKNIHKSELHTIFRSYLSSEAETSTALSHTYQLDLKEGTALFPHLWEEDLIISDTWNCIHTFPLELIAEAKKDLKFQQIKLYRFFIRQEQAKEAFHITSHTERFFDKLVDLDLKVEINISFSEIDYFTLSGTLEHFLLHFKHRYNTAVLNNWSIKMEDSSKSDGYTKKFSILFRKIESLAQSIVPEMKIGPAQKSTVKNIYSYNSVLLLPHIFHQTLEGKLEGTAMYRELYDCLNPFRSPTRLQAYNGIFAEYHEKKPIYYAWKMLSMLGDQLVYAEPGIAVTKRGSDYILLLYDDFNRDELVNPKTKKQPINVTLKINQIEKSYAITKFYLDSENSLFRHRSNMNFPSHMSREEVATMNQATAPSISFSYLSKEHTSNLFSIQLNPYSAMLMILKEVLEREF